MHPQECPVCGAHDAFVEAVRDGDEYYVECVDCQIYLATRRAYRLFQYLRTRGDPVSLARLERLSASLRSRPRGAAVHLDYDTWELFGTPPASPSSR